MQYQARSHLTILHHIFIFLNNRYHHTQDQATCPAAQPDDQANSSNQPTHPLVEKLKAKVDEDLVNVLFDQAVFSEGGQLKDLAEFVKRMNKLIG